MKAYYNEIDPYCAQWLRNLIAAGHIAPGDVDERSIAEVRPDDLRGYTQCHFFAGIAGWSYALRLAGWRDDRAVWTGSCPCQPLSGAGQRKGHADERHLWPAFYRLIAERRPSTILGEQVASVDGREWLAGVRADLEALGYAVGAADLCAAGVGAPHIRQRLWWVAESASEGWRWQSWRDDRENGRPAQELGRLRDAGGMSDADGRHASAEGIQRGGQHGQRAQDGGVGGLGDAEPGRLESRNVGLIDTRTSQPWTTGVPHLCTDGKARRIEPSSFPLAHGIPARVGRLRSYGNAIVPQVAARFIEACTP